MRKPSFWRCAGTSVHGIRERHPCHYPLVSLSPNLGQCETLIFPQIAGVKGVIICLSGLQLGGAPVGWVFPSIASCVANMLELACISSCTAPGGIKVDADFGSCECV